MAAAIVIFSAAVMILNFADWRKLRGRPWSWIKLAFALIGAYWMGLYTVILLAPDGYFNPITFGQNYVRPMFLMTLAVILSATLTGRRGR